MKQFLRPIYISIGVAFCSLITAIPAYGQKISSDGTTNTNVNQTGNVFEITGGAEAGNNLFHSFQEFSVPTGNEAFFNNADAIDNIISRVTGGSISNIDGLIHANGGANLFLINPAGIVFGRNASLNISGSFLGSTADSIIFPEGEFSATDTQSPPLLTINAPIGLRLGNNPGKITNSSQASLDGAVNGFDLFGIPVPAGLQTLPGQTLALVGGEINFENGNVSAPGGRIELGSIAGNSVVSIMPLEQGFTLGYEEVSGFQDIQLSQFSVIDTTDLTGSTSGAINLQGKQIALTDASAIFSINFGDESGGEIAISASEFIEIIRDDANVFTIASQDGAGAAGNIIVNTNDLSLVDGGVIASFPSPTAPSGDININASNSIEVIGVRTDRRARTAITIEPFSDATGGSGTNLTIETDKLIVRDGAFIGSIVYGTSQGANVSITASDIEIVGEGELGSSAIVAQAEPDSTAKAGNLTIETKRLITRDGGFVSVSTFGEGESGDLIVNASDFINLSGTASTANLFRGSSGLFSLADVPSSGKGGDLRVSTPQLIIENGAKVSAETFGTERAGDVNLSVARLIVKDGGQITAGSLFAEDTSNRPLGRGGTLTINATESVEIFGTGKIGETTINSSLSTLTQGTGDAGNLNINTPNLTVKDGGEITASTTASTLDAGKGGELDITAQQLTVSNGGTITARTSGTGKAGNIILKIADNVTLSGTDSGLFANTEAGSTGDGGSILTKEQTPETVIVRDGATIAVNSDGSGQGGSIEITAENLTLNNGSITAETASSQGGNITLNIGDTLSFEKSGKITATAGTAQGAGDGGNIKINADFILAFPTDNTYKITAEAFEGNGGNIAITTKGFFGAEFVDISASSEKGLEGDVTIEVSEIEPARGLTKLPSNIVDASRLIAKSCLAGGEG